MREKNGMLEPPYCFFYSSVQALTPQFGSFLLCFAMPGILCLGEITDTCQSSIKRGKIPALTFSRGLVFQTRTGRLRGGGKKKKRERAQEREWAKRQTVPSVSVQCPVFQAHPKLILHRLCFLVLSLCPRHPSSCSRLSSLTPLASEVLKEQNMVTLTLSGDGLMSSVSTKVPYSLFTTSEHFESQGTQYK